MTVGDRMRSARILVVEDERIVALDLSQRLQQLGYEFAGQAVNAEQVLMVTAAVRPDLVAGSKYSCSFPMVIFQQPT